jgi:hypothetical protein
MTEAFIHRDELIQTTGAAPAVLAGRRPESGVLGVRPRRGQRVAAPS